MSESIRGKSAVKSKQDLPPPRDRKGIRPVTPPFMKTSMARFNYYMAVFVALVLAFYAWRLMIWKAEAGSWWNLMLGKQPPAMRNGDAGNGSGVSMADVTPTAGSRVDLTVEERINELASALGMPSKDLASAIAVAVHDHVPPATLSSVAAHQTGDAVKYLVDPEGASESDASATAIIPAATKGAKMIHKAFDAAVGMDEPPSEM